MNNPSIERTKARETGKMLLTLKFRLRDKHAKGLDRQARAVNFVWNYLNETQRKAAQAQRKWLTGYDFQTLTAGASKELGLHSHTVQAVCHQYYRSRRQRNKPWLRWRGRKSLGWVPFSQLTVRLDGARFKFRRIAYETMHQRSIPAGAVIHSGSFNQNSKGQWFINITVEMPSIAPAKQSAVGIDLGLKDLATLSTGEKIAAPQHYRKHQERLGRAQRANKKRLTRNIALKVANARRDHLHKASARIASAHNVIVVGNVSSSKLAQTKFAKSVLDASWSTLRAQLSYKAIRRCGTLIVADERHSSQTCSACGCMPEGRPRGIAGLGIREWTCGDCGAVHDRDVNAARNILRVGLDALAEGAAHGGAATANAHESSQPEPQDKL